MARQHADQLDDVDVDEVIDRKSDVTTPFPYSADMDESSSEVVSLNTPLRHEVFYWIFFIEFIFISAKYNKLISRKAYIPLNYFYLILAIHFFHRSFNSIGCIANTQNEDQRSLPLSRRPAPQRVMLMMTKKKKIPELLLSGKCEELFQIQIFNKFLFKPK